MLIVVLSKCNIFKRVEQYMFHTVFYYTVQTMLSFRSLLTLPTSQLQCKPSRRAERWSSPMKWRTTTTAVSPAEAKLFQSGVWTFPSAYWFKLAKFSVSSLNLGNMLGCQTKAKELLKYDLLLLSSSCSVDRLCWENIWTRREHTFSPTPNPHHPTVHIRWNLLFLKKYRSTNVIGFCFPSKAT